MSADVLREAAALMRERAEAVTGDIGLCARPDQCAHRGFCRYPLLGDVPRADAEHIASWHPAVALAVADWLQSVSVDVDKRDNPERVGGRYEALRIPDERAALAVARAYLNP